MHGVRRRWGDAGKGCSATPGKCRGLDRGRVGGGFAASHAYLRTKFTPPTTAMGTATIAIAPNLGRAPRRWYRAPERLRGGRGRGAGGDLWSAGCVVAEMLARRPLFPGEGRKPKRGQKPKRTPKRALPG